MDLFLLSHPWDFLASYPSYHRTLPHECVLYPNSPPIRKSTVARPHSLDLFISPTCPGTHNNPLHCMFVSPIFSTYKRRESRRESHREVEGGNKNKKKIHGNNYMPLLSMNPVLAVSQLQNLWTNLEACKVPHYSSRGGVFQEQLAWMATEHREGFVWGFWPRTSFAG